MLRRSPISRKTPLRSGGWLKRTAAKLKRPRYTGPDTHTKIRLTLRSDGACERCGRDDVVQVHHRKPRRMGGSKAPDINSLSNVTHLCLSCHEWTEREPAEALCEGWRLHANELPESVPVLTRHGLVRLTNHGTWEMA